MAHSESSLWNERDIGGLPDGAFRRLTVAKQHVCAIVRRDPARVERDPDAGAYPLSERSRGDIDPWQARRGVTLEIGVRRRSVNNCSRSMMPASAQAAYRIGAAWPLDRTNRSLSGFCGIARVVSHLGEEQRRHDLGGRAARARVPAAGLARGANRIDAKASGDVLQRGHARRVLDGQGGSLLSVIIMTHADAEVRVRPRARRLAGRHARPRRHRRPSDLPGAASRTNRWPVARWPAPCSARCSRGFTTSPTRRALSCSDAGGDGAPRTAAAELCDSFGDHRHHDRGGALFRARGARRDRRHSAADRDGAVGRTWHSIGRAPHVCRFGGTRRRSQHCPQTTQGESASISCISSRPG